jgi:hypothetical protein
MTYQELVKKVSKALTAADASGIGEHVAVQVNVTGEAEGWFYVEVAEGKVMVEPYTYDDKDACMTADGADVLALSTGKLALEQGLTEGRLTVDGSYDKFMLLSGIFAQMPVKKARKTAAKKTDDAEKPAKKPAAKKTTKKTTTKKAAETAEVLTAPVAEEAPAKRKCGRPKKAETAAKTAAKTTAKKTAKKTDEK